MKSKFMKNHAISGLLLGFVFLVVSGFLISKSSAESEAFKDSKQEIIKILNFNERLLSFRDWVFSESAWQEKKVKYEAAVEQGDVHYKNALNYGYMLLMAASGFLVIILLIYSRKRIYYGLTMASCFIGLALLGMGIMNPILEMAAFKKDMTIKVYVKPDDIPYFEDAKEYLLEASKFTKEIAGYLEYVPWIGEDLAESAESLLNEGEQYLDVDGQSQIGFDKVFPGYTYFYYQNKGIMDVISLLWKSGNKPVAIAIGTFSVIVPAIKLFFTLIILLLPTTGMKRMRKFLSYIAKWSMADVFVVGAFLAYLSFANMSPGVEMDANVLFGLYFFGGYVMISIFLGFFLDASIKQRLRFADSENNIDEFPEENSYQQKSDTE